jgi:uncharacterized protein (TIGR02145 family)
VWVFVDYNNAGKMERLPVTGATASAGTVTKVPGNDKGVWVAGNARSTGSFSATVQLFTTVSSVGGACAYASNYPPVGEYSSDAPMLSFTGTPMYDIQLAKSGGGSVTIKSGDTFLLPCEYTVTLFTDATGAPGQLNGTPFNNGSVPRYAASTQVWTVGSQIWSDVINIPACNHDAFTNSNTDPYCRSYTMDGKKWFYYNWTYVNENKNTLCPSPWRVPTLDDFQSLDKAFGGDGTSRSVSASWLYDNYFTVWGGALNTGLVSASGVATSNCVSYWGSTEYGSCCAYSLWIDWNGRIRPEDSRNYDANRYWGFLVRCVKEGH